MSVEVTFCMFPVASPKQRAGQAYSACSRQNRSDIPKQLLIAFNCEHQASPFFSLISSPDRHSNKLEH